MHGGVSSSADRSDAAAPNDLRDRLQVPIQQGFIKSSSHLTILVHYPETDTVLSLL